MINEVSCHSRGVFECRLYTRLNRSVLSLISVRPPYSITADLRSTAKSPPMELLAKYIASFYLKKCSPPYIRACLCHNNYVDKHCFFINKFLFENLTKFRPIIDKTLLSVNNISSILQGLFSSRFFFDQLMVNNTLKKHFSLLSIRVPARLASLRKYSFWCSLERTDKTNCILTFT